MVDFEKLRKDRGVSKSIDPIEIFRRLPKTSKINDLWNSQAEVLREWDLRRKDKDAVLKLNTGGGKTLVGLIIAQSIANETNGPTMYLCPTVQLTEQIYAYSKEYGFKTTLYKSGLDADFLSGKHIMIATYSALFNAQSKFGTTESIKDHVHLNGIIIDDAHAAFSNIRDYFTLSIEKKSHPELYSELCTLFRNDFMKLNKAGTFDDIVNRSDPSILEVPYWSWKQRSDQIREKLAETISDTSPFVFTWPLIRDEFDYCHALISYRSFSITPLYPLIDKFSSFSKCPRRVYMSATLANDSSIIRTFDANRKSVSEPITSKSLAGVGERMILAPALMDIDLNQIENIVKQVIEKISTNAGVLILVPSNKDLKIWMDIATVPRESKDVKEYVDKLRNKKVGAYAFSNRYDGLDLPDESCRLLVMAGRPSGDNIYDSFRHRVLKNSRVINTSLAQRIEQGIGRGTSVMSTFKCWIKSR
jgi:Rad3-related DNA helicase